MKLLKLRFANLNSLYGEWTIDFEYPEFSSHGLFAITGPTGAGKSTILDAIALALYGRTPRLGTISKAANEIMSRDSAQCFSEVTFQSSKGVFRAHWSQRRARSKGEGNLQSPKHDLTDVATTKILTDKKKETLSIIQECVGLDYDQFMRSIMLAQGEFATFLKSDDAQRAAILAKITGTDIYARIGAAVHQRYRLESEELQITTDQTASIELLIPEAVAELENRIASNDCELDRLNNRRKELDATIHWLTRIDELDTVVNRLRDELHQAQRELEAESSLHQSLERARRASTLRNPLENLKRSRQTANTFANQLVEIRNELLNLDNARQAGHQKVLSLQNEIQALTATMEASRERWRETRNLDRTIQQVMLDLDKANESITKQVQKIAVLRNEKGNVEGVIETIQRELSILRIYQSENPNDALLGNRWPLIEHVSQTYQEGLQALSIQQNELTSIELQSLDNSKVESEKNETLASIVLSISAIDQQIAEEEQKRSIVMAGHSTIELQNLLRSLDEKHKSLQEHHGNVNSLLETDANIADRSTTLTVLRDQLDELQLHQSSLDEQIEKQSQLIEVLRTSVEKDLIIASLEEHRSRLVAGQPCKLCGSLDHPWADPNTKPRPGETAEQLCQAQEILSSQKIERESVAREFDRKQGARERERASLEELTRLRQSLAEQWSAHASRHGLELDLTQTAFESSRQRLEHSIDREARLRTQNDESNSLLEYINDLQTQRVGLTSKRSEAEQEVLSILHQKTEYDLSRQQAIERLARQQTLIEKAISDLNLLLNECSVSWSEDWLSIKEAIQSRAATWQTTEQSIARLENLLVEKKSRLVAIDEQIDPLEGDLGEMRISIKNQTENLDTLRRNRHALFGCNDPEVAERELQQRLENSREACSVSVVASSKRDFDWQLLDRSVAQKEAELAAIQKQADAQQVSLEVDLQSSGFVDAADVESALQTEDVIERWTARIVTVEENMRSSKLAWQHKEAELTTLRLENRSQSSIETLNQQSSELEGLAEQQRLEKVDAQYRIDEHREKSKRFEAMGTQLAMQKERLERWGVLRELIGSVDGDKFRKFAQGITFEVLISQANAQLRKLTDRYDLKKGEEGLSLVVVDHYQSSRSRTAANLSGGETFLVSLSLALGLSTLASQNVRIDSLFLDEGFGTLDEETLDVALHTLSNLWREGKLVGLISHVPGLTQQIPVRIEVVKGSLGRSRLRGPGVSQGA